jgi:hypothetical protein
MTTLGNVPATFKVYTPFHITTIDDNHRVISAKDNLDNPSKHFPMYRKGNTWVHYMRNGNIVAYLNHNTAVRHIEVSCALRRGQER